MAALRAMMTDRVEDFHAALWIDLRRNRSDADLTDVKASPPRPTTRCYTCGSG